ncbi:hypothetical protein BC831DRAFT_465937 [Entophlyctis helioformis]|nr:hypothetical protein BC831DRAFT_465937 [Entophlyctis helioformis]
MQPPPHGAPSASPAGADHPDSADRSDQTDHTPATTAQTDQTSTAQTSTATPAVDWADIFACPLLNSPSFLADLAFAPSALPPAHAQGQGQGQAHANAHAHAQSGLDASSSSSSVLASVSAHNRNRLTTDPDADLWAIEDFGLLFNPALAFDPFAATSAVAVAMPDSMPDPLAVHHNNQQHHNQQHLLPTAMTAAAGSQSAWTASVLGSLHPNSSMASASSSSSLSSLSSSLAAMPIDDSLTLHQLPSKRSSVDMTDAAAAATSSSTTTPTPTRPASSSLSALTALTAGHTQTKTESPTAADDDPLAGAQPLTAKRRKIAQACTHCKKAHVSCETVRPCRRCVKKGLQDSCVDAPRKPLLASDASPPMAMAALPIELGLVGGTRKGRVKGRPSGAVVAASAAGASGAGLGGAAAAVAKSCGTCPVRILPKTQLVEAAAAVASRKASSMLAAVAGAAPASASSCGKLAADADGPVKIESGLDAGSSAVAAQGDAAPPSAPETPSSAAILESAMHVHEQHQKQQQLQQQLLQQLQLQQQQNGALGLGPTGSVDVHKASDRTAMDANTTILDRRWTLSQQQFVSIAANFLPQHLPVGSPSAAAQQQQQQHQQQQEQSVGSPFQGMQQQAQQVQPWPAFPQMQQMAEMPQHMISMSRTLSSSSSSSHHSHQHHQTAGMGKLHPPLQPKQSPLMPSPLSGVQPTIPPGPSSTESEQPAIDFRSMGPLEAVLAAQQIEPGVATHILFLVRQLSERQRGGQSHLPPQLAAAASSATGGSSLMDSRPSLRVADYPSLLAKSLPSTPSAVFSPSGLLYTANASFAHLVSVPLDDLVSGHYCLYGLLDMPSMLAVLDLALNYALKKDPHSFGRCVVYAGGNAGPDAAGQLAQARQASATQQQGGSGSGSGSGSGKSWARHCALSVSTFRDVDLWVVAQFIPV